MKLALTASFLLLLGACGAKAADKLAGSYVFDSKASVASILEEMKKQPGYDAAAAPAAAEMITGMVKDMSMELKADGTMTLKGMGKEGAGTWKLDGSKISMTAKFEGKEETKHGIVDGDNIKITDDMQGKPMTLVMTKKK